MKASIESQAEDFVRKYIHPEPKQVEFLDALHTHKFILYGGAAGGGKSYILRWAALYLLLWFYTAYGVRGGVVGLFCEDYPELIRRQIIKISTEFPPELGRLVESRTHGFQFEMSEELGGGHILLLNLDEPSKYDSVEFLGIFVDELTKNPWTGPRQVGSIFDELRKRLRWPDLPQGVNFPFAAGTNPGGKCHGEVKRLWIDGDLPPELKPYASQFKLIRSYAKDNPHNPTDYYTWLLSLPEPLRSALANGDWTLFQGQFFQEWRWELHVCKPFTIPTYWKRFAETDWGYASPACIHWFAVSPDGKVYVYREFYERHWTNERIAKRAVELTGSEKLFYRELDPSCFPAEKETQRGRSDAEQLAQFGWSCTKAAHARQTGWSQMRQYLHWEQNAQGIYTRLPMVQWFETCTNAIRTIPTLTYDAHNTDDLDTDGEDHAADVDRYGLMSRPPISEIPLSEMSEDYADAARRAQHDEKEARR